MATKAITQDGVLLFAPTPIGILDALDAASANTRLVPAILKLREIHPSVQKSNMGMRHIFYTTTAPARRKNYPSLFY